MKLQIRKPNRLKEYDYSQNGAYFITICTRKREKLLWNVGANCVRPQDKISLSDIGIIIDNEIKSINKIYSNIVKIDKYVIMPNHIHMIISIDSDGRTQFAPTISRIIKQFKGSITKQIGFSIFQRSFHDRIIRNQKEYHKIWEYTDTNPLKWEQDCFYV